MSNVIMNVGITGSATSFLPALRNKQYDAMSVTEPLATEFQKMGVAHRWLSYQDVIPSFQSAYLAIGPAFARDHHDAAVRFVRAFMRACRDIAASNGKWTPELIDSESKWSGLDRSAFAAIPGPAYPGDGKIDIDSIRRQEQLWLALNMLQKKVPIDALIDDSYVRSTK
jgi:ABC-type nitrate/sulfonate/bicarbonate transport system substrate-binding protein